MAVYKCSVCGFIYDEEKNGKPLAELSECPVCGQPISKFVPVKDETVTRRESPMEDMGSFVSSRYRLADSMRIKMIFWRKVVPQYRYTSLWACLELTFRYSERSSIVTG